ncbi:MAG: DMT family transporter [Chloroflexi bacterium]|nr:DMT family transporter [Chloroflexota bacterium]
MKRGQANLTLGVIALIWGSTFVLVKNALDDVDPFTFVAWRFIAASIVLLLIFHRRMVGITRQELLAGALIGVWLVQGYVYQTIGLQTTTTAKAGFITGLSVVIVPVLSTVLLRHPPTRGAVLGVVAATTGLGMLTLDKDLTVETGDLWVLACAFAFALHIITVGRFSPHHDPVRLSIVQIGTVAVLATGSAFVFETPTLDLPSATWGAIMFTGVVATALVFSLQVYVQRSTTSTQTALIFALEPVFAAFFGWWWASERLGAREIVGCGLILCGMIVSEGGATLDEPEQA